MSNQDQDEVVYRSGDDDPPDDTNRLGEVKRVLNNSYGKPGKKVLKVHCNEKWDGSSVMYPPVPNLSKHIDLLQTDVATMTDVERDDQKMRMEYEAEVTVFRALEKLRKNCIVLHQIEYKHFLFEQVYSFHKCTSDRCRQEGEHACHKAHGGLEGETDFLVIGESYFVIIEVKHCKPENIGEDCNLIKAKNQAEKSAKFLERIMKIMGNGGSINQVFQFYAFPFLKENEVQPDVIQGNTQITQCQETRGKILFEDVFMNFDLWWEQNIETFARDFEPLSEDVRSAVIGIAGSTESFDTGNRIKTIDENLRKSKITRENEKGHKKGRPVLNNAHVHEACKEMQTLDICYIRHEQKLALDCEEKVLVLNGPAGVGKTVILLTKLLQLAQNTSLDNKVVLFTFGHQAALFHEDCIKRAGIACSLKKIKNDTSSEEIESFIQNTYQKVLILSIPIFSFPVEFLGRINSMVRLFKDHSVFMDDVQCFAVPSSTKTSPEYYSNVSQKFQELMKTLSECSFARIAIDAVQLFYFPNSENGTLVAEAINKITDHAKIVTLQSNLRNSYDMSRLLAVIRVELRKEFPYIAENLMPSQKFSHFIHGNKPVIHVLSTSERAKLSDKIMGVIEGELRLLGVGAFERRNTIANDKVRVLEFKNITDFEVADNRKIDEKLKQLLISGTYVEMIRNCYSREWAAVIALICPCNMSYNELLSRVYLAASRARVYCSLIFFMRESKPPPFFSSFLKCVESSDSVIVKKYKVTQEPIN